MLQTLPVETIDHVFHYLDTPEDLLHAALACKTFHDMIIRTYHLHFTSIRCDLEDTPLKSTFWHTLSTSRRFCSMVQLFDHSSYPKFPREPAFRINDVFIYKWTESIPRLSSPPGPTSVRANFQCLLQCLKNFRKCRSIHVRDFYLSHNEINELVACVLANLSDNLETLVLYFLAPTANDVPRCIVFPINCSFNRLTTFSFSIYFRHDLRTLLNSILDLLIYGCFTLVNFRFGLFFRNEDESFHYPSLFKDANWPSLKRLELSGQSELFLGSESENHEAGIFFMARHTQLERLRLAFIHDDVEQVFQNHLLYNVPPRRWSLDFDFFVHLETPLQIYHITITADINDPDTFRLPSSLKSCTIIIASHTRPRFLEEIITDASQLEYLCIRLESCSRSEGCIVEGCQCVDRRYGGSNFIPKLRNLTHFGLFTPYGMMLQNPTLAFFQKLAHQLPHLSHVYHFEVGIAPTEYQVIKRPDASVDLVPTLKKCFDPDLTWDFRMD